MLPILFCAAYAGAPNDKQLVFTTSLEESYLTAVSTISQADLDKPNNTLFATLLQQKGGTVRVLGSQSQFIL